MAALFAVEPPAKGASSEDWERWISADKRKRASIKRKRTMALEHQDMDASHLGNLTFGFQGDFENGTGELVAVVQANQETDCLVKRPRGYRLTRAQRRRKEKMRRRA